MAVDCGELFLWEKHWLRLVSSATKLDINISNLHAATTYEIVRKAVTDFGSAAGRVRISFMDGTASERWGGDSINTAISVLVGRRGEIPADLRLTVSRHVVNSTSPLTGVKSCNYLEPLMSYQEANKRGFNEAIRLNERGEITSGCMANVFWLKGGRLYTPSLKTGCLRGTTREYLLENLECEEVEAPIDELHGVEAIFMTSAGLGVVRAAQFEDTRLPSVNHPITRLLPF